MPKLDWRAFHEAHPTSHRVRVVLLKDSEGAPIVPLRDVQLTVARLVGKLRPAGAFAIAISRETGEPEILCAFTEEGDADLLAATLPGQPSVIAERLRLVVLGEQEYEEVLERAGSPSPGRKPRQRPGWPGGP